MTPNTTHLRDPLCALGLGFGSGLLKPAPGTWGTLAAMPVAWLLTMLPLSIGAALVALAAVLGIVICSHTARKIGVHDHPAIVWDEFVGVWLTVLFVPGTVVNLALGFVLFRIFDILKPWPIRWCDRHVSGGLGIMVDDILAGAIAAGLLYWVHHSGVLSAVTV